MKYKILNIDEVVEEVKELKESNNLSYRKIAEITNSCYVNVFDFIANKKCGNDRLYVWKYLFIPQIKEYIKKKGKK